MTLSLCPAPDPRQMQLAPGTRGAPPSCLEPVQELPENPVLELRPVSPASAAAELKDVPAVASAQGPGPELEPHEPSGLGPRALAGMAPGVAEPGPGPEPTNPCAASPWDIPGLVSGPELEPHESSGAGPVAPAGMAQGLEEPEVALEPTTPCSMSTRDLPREEEQTILAFLPRLVAKQLTLMCAVSGAGSRGRGWAFPVSRATPHLPSPDVDSCDVGPHPSFPTDSPCALRESPHPQALNVHMGTVGPALRDPCRPMRRMEHREGGQGLAGWEGQGRGGVLREVLPGP